MNCYGEQITQIKVYVIYPPDETGNTEQVEIWETPDDFAGSKCCWNTYDNPGSNYFGYDYSPSCSDNDFDDTTIITLGVDTIANWDIPPSANTTYQFKAIGYTTLGWSEQAITNFTAMGISGCTDPEACNYNPNATDDDGTCVVHHNCGDLNGDGLVNIFDIITMAYCILGDGECTDEMDLNQDGVVNIVDIIQLVNWIFEGFSVPSLNRIYSPGLTNDDIGQIETVFQKLIHHKKASNADLKEVKRVIRKNIPKQKMTKKDNIIQKPQKDEKQILINRIKKKLQNQRKALRKR